MIAAEIIQANYEELEQLAKRFGQKAESNAAMYMRLQRSMDQLVNGSWVGEAATSFFMEMDRDVIPAVQRLINALEQAQTVTLESSRGLRLLKNRRPIHLQIRLPTQTPTQHGAAYRCRLQTRMASSMNPTWKILLAFVYRAKTLRV